MTDFVRKKPFGVAVLMAILGLAGTLGSIAGLLALITLPFDDGPFRINDEVVGRTHFLRVTVPFLAVYLAICLLALGISWAIHAEDPRSRPLLLAYSISVFALTPFYVLLGVPVPDAVGSSVPLVLIPVAAWLYLYRKRSVVQYYAALVRDREGSELE